MRRSGGRADAALRKRAALRWQGQLDAVEGLAAAGSECIGADPALLQRGHRDCGSSGADAAPRRPSRRDAAAAGVALRWGRADLESRRVVGDGQPRDTATRTRQAPHH
jgi:hypothetical protein